jgi:hypothetical protein
MPGLFRKKQQAQADGQEQPRRSPEARARVAELMSIAEVFGTREQLCPSCEKPLPRFPKRKSKCRSCGEFVYPRKNPITERYVLLSEKDFPLLEELAYLSNGYFDAWFEDQRELDLIRKQLALQWGVDDYRKVPVADAMWRRTMNRTTECLAKGDWAGYRAAQAEGIRQLSGERRYENALPLIYEYIYLTYNIDDNDELSRELGLVLPKKMNALREGYLAYMENCDLTQVFGGAPGDAFRKYEKERSEHYVVLRTQGRLDDCLASIPRARSGQK